MIAQVLVTLALLAAPEEGPPPDPVAVQTRLCFQGPAAESLAACERALAMPTGASTHSHLLIAQALWQEKGRPGSALPVLRMAVDADPEDITSHLILGWYLDHSKRPREADEEFRTVARIAAGRTENVDMDTSVLSVLKQSQEELGPFFEGLARGFDRVGQPRMASAFYSGAILNWGRKDDFAALSAFYERALALTPENPSLHVGFADLLRAQAAGLPSRSSEALQLLKAAAANLDQALRLAPEDSVYRYESGRVRLDIGDLQGGIGELQEALRLRPEYPAAAAELRLSVLAKGGPGLETQAAARPDTPAALERLRECIRKAGSRGEMACHDALKIGLSARNAAKAHLYLAENLRGKYAAEEYRAAIQTDGSYALPFFRLAQRQAGSEPELGGSEEAIRNLQRAIELRPAWIAAHELLARTLQHLNRLPEATAELEKALTLDPGDEGLPEQLRLLRSSIGAQEWAKAPRRESPASSVTAAAPANTARSAGLLLVFGSSSWWIVRSGTELRVNGPTEDALVPSKQGWWRVGVAKPPLEDELEANDNQPRSAFDQLWAVPLGAAVPEHAPQEAPCAGAEGVESRSYRIDWLTPEYAGITLGYQAQCAGSQPASGQSSYVLPFDALRRHADNPQGIKLPDLAGEGAWTAMQEGAEIEKLRVAAGLSPAGDATVSIEPDRWTMRRIRGRWQLLRPAETDGSGVEISTTHFQQFDIPFEPPTKLLVQTELTPGWDAIQEAVPDAVDAFSSPSQDWVVVLTPSRLLGFEVLKGAIGKRLFRRTIDEDAARRPLLAQWVTGATVGKWSQALSPVLRKSVE